MKIVVQISIFLFAAAQIFAQQWGKPIVLGEWNKIPLLGAVVSDSSGNIYITTSYCNWIVPKDKDTVYPIRELKDHNRTYTYVVYQNKDGYKNITEPRIEFGANGYVTKYREEMLFVRNDSIYSLNEILKVDTISSPIFKYLGDDKWIFQRRTMHANYSIEYHGFYIFDAKLMKIKHFPLSKTGGVPSNDFITQYDDSFWFFSYPDHSLTRFNDEGYEYYNIFDSIHKQTPDFKNIKTVARSGDKIYLAGKDSSEYSFDLATKSLKLEVVFDEEHLIYQLEKEKIEKSSKIHYFFLPKWLGEISVHELSLSYDNEPDASESIVYYSTGDNSELKKIQFDDTTEYVRGKFFYVTNDGKLWFKIKYYRGGDRNQVFHEGVISFDPLADTTAVESMPTLIALKPAPNPAKTYTKIKFFIHPHTKDKAKFKIYNYSGVLIKELDNDFDYNSQTAIATKTIDVETLKTGVYYLIIDNGTEKRGVGFAVE